METEYPLVVAYEWGWEVQVESLWVKWGMIANWYRGFFLQ